MAKVFSLILLCTLVFSCKEKTKQDTATVLYQCPMDCENGKTYTEKGSCSVCKMDLKTLAHSEDCTCASHEGKCKCEDGKCTCSTCPEHSKSSKKEATCICKDKKECKCEKGKCTCDKCPEHS